MISLAMHLGLAAPLSFMVPHQPPAVPPSPVVQAKPGPVVSDTPPAPAPTTTTTTPTPPPTPPTTTSTTTYTGLECVVTISGGGYSMTYSPGPAIGGQCAQGIPEPVASTW